MTASASTSPSHRQACPSSGQAAPRACSATSPLRHTLWVMILTLLLAPPLVANESGDAPDADGPSFHDRLEATNRLSSRIDRMRARFVQARFTPMLRRPLESRGLMRQVGRSVRWDTREPQLMTLFTDGRILANYDLEAELVEIYPVSDMVGGWSGGAMPRLGDLEASFAIESAELTEPMRQAFQAVTLQRWPVDAAAPSQPASGDADRDAERDPDGEPEPEPVTASQILTLRMTPHTEQLRRSVTAVTVWMHEPSGALLGFETQTPDGERTLVTLEAIELHPPIQAGQLALRLPDHVRVSYPMGEPDDAGRE